MRKHYLDNIRWATVLLVLIYHIFYLYNAEGIFGGIGPFREIQPWDDFMNAVYPWFMVLLFVIAGMSARYALEKRTRKEFLHSKVDRLLIPSTLGILLFPAVTGFIYISLGGSRDMIPTALLYPISALSGIGHLWFLHVLFLYSVLIALLHGTQLESRLLNIGEKAGLPALILMALPIWGSSLILNIPVLTTYRFGIYLLSYLLGFFVMSHDSVQEILEKNRWVLLFLMILSFAAYMSQMHGKACSDDALLKHPLTNLYLWMAVLAILGCGKKWVNRTGKWAAYLSSSSFGIYIVHFLMALLLCLGLKNLPLPIVLKYCLASLGTIVLSVVCWELLRKIPIVRYMMFGIRKKR